MYYLPILLVCSLHTLFVGDADSGPTCIKLSNAAEIHYGSYTECTARVRELVESAKANTARLELILPGPWHYRGHCYIPVVDEVMS